MREEHQRIGLIFACNLLPSPQHLPRSHSLIKMSILMRSCFTFQADDSSFSYADFGDSIDITTFEQILEMDDDEDDREFSRSIVFGFFEQAESTFENMETAL